MSAKKKPKHHYLDYGILLPYLFLAIFGIIMVYSSTSYLQYLTSGNYDPPFAYAKSQGMYLVISLVVMAVLYRMRTKFLKNKNLIYFIVASVSALLIVTLFLGKEVNGAKGWLVIAGFSMQPAEYLKLVMVWFLAYTFASRQVNLKENFFVNYRVPLIVSVFLIGLVLVQPDLGGAVIITLIAAIIIFSSGIPSRLSLVITAAAGALAFFFTEIIVHFGQHIPFIKNYVYNRFAVFKNPFIDPLDGGHQLVNSYYAIHNGGWFGLGLGNSIQKKGFLPEAHTDFVFSILIEEMGLVGAIVILGILFFMIIRILLIGIRSKNTFNSLMMIGIAGIFLVQVFINLGGVLGVIPMTGVTFPFLSQGGNSLLTLSAAVAFALNISADEKRRKEQLTA